MNISERICDFCGEATALLYCKADSAKLCLACDRQVHATNPLFTKHTRSQLCDSCNSSPVSILCSTEKSVLCQNCDWETHSHNIRDASRSSHDRRPLEAFMGCPSVGELLSYFGFDELSQKDLFLNDEKGDDSYGFSDLLVWETPAVYTLDDLIGDTRSGHGFQAMGVPPPPKNRNCTCGKHKEELISQLRELAKSEPDVNYNFSEDVDSFVGFQPLRPERSLQPSDLHTDVEYEMKPNISQTSEASEFQWLNDGKDAANQSSSTLCGTYAGDCLVPDNKSDIVGNDSHPNGPQEGEAHNSVGGETLVIIPKPAVHEFNSQERDTALSRYKQKKKTRRYDKHIRYETRKARAESRTRIKGRFAKMDTCM